MLFGSANRSTNGLPKARVSEKARYDPSVSPIVESSSAEERPVEVSPSTPVTSPGSGATTTWRVWRRMNARNPQPPRESMKARASAWPPRPKKRMIPVVISARQGAEDREQEQEA